MGQVSRSLSCWLYFPLPVAELPQHGPVAAQPHKLGPQTHVAHPHQSGRAALTYACSNLLTGLDGLQREQRLRAAAARATSRLVIDQNGDAKLSRQCTVLRERSMTRHIAALPQSLTVQDPLPMAGPPPWGAMRPELVSPTERCRPCAGFIPARCWPCRRWSYGQRPTKEKDCNSVALPLGPAGCGHHDDRGASGVGGARAGPECAGELRCCLRSRAARSTAHAGGATPRQWRSGQNYRHRILLNRGHGCELAR